MNAEQWREVLIAGGARAATAGPWAMLFERHCQPEAFSMGMEEVDDFAAQVLHESAGLERLTENLNYSAQRLQQVFPARFPSIADAMRCAHNPEALANTVYGNRLGNNAWGDGFKFRGRGLIQCTGRANYALLQELTGLPLLDAPDMLAQPELALKASILWWEARVPDEAINTIERTTRAVNGPALAGLQDRRDKWRRINVAMAARGLVA